MSLALMPCPFCGSQAELRQASWTGIVYVRCSGKNCLVSPNTYSNVANFDGMTREEAKQKSIRFWNDRFVSVEGGNPYTENELKRLETGSEFS